MGLGCWLTDGTDLHRWDWPKEFTEVNHWYIFSAKGLVNRKNLFLENGISPVNQSNSS